MKKTTEQPRPNKVLCRVETDHVAAFQFLAMNRYPYFWSPDQLAEGIVVRVMDLGERTIGYVWGHWLEHGVLAFHVCALEGERLPFFSSDFLDQVVRLGFWIGADKLATALEHHPRPKPIERLLKSLGFAVEHNAHGMDTCFTLNTRTYLHGLQ